MNLTIMKRIRYLSILMMLICHINMLAQIDSGFNPANPGEPNAPNFPQYSQLTLVADPVGGGNPSTSGKFVVGSVINLSAQKSSGFRFINWTNADGDILSTSENFQITKAEADETITAHYVYEPSSPGEPLDPWLQIKVPLNVKAADGGSVSGGGKYLPNTPVTLNASPAGNYVFKNWTDETGTVISTTAQFSYTVKNVEETLTAHFTFVPSSPGEPNAPDMTPKHHVFLVAGEGGTVGANIYDKEGKNVSVTANCNSGYVFLGWFKDNILYNNNTSFTYTIETEDVTFEARFAYNPASPSEPQTPNNAKKYIFYIENANGFQGENIIMSVFLSSLHAIGNMTFQLSFPESMVPVESGITYSEKLCDYTKKCTKIDATTLKFEFTGGELPVSNGALVTFTIPVPADYPTGTRNPVRMNQISFVELGGSSTTTIARNANLGVFKRGDVNGDNTIDIADVHGVMLNLISLIDATDGFIVEAADVNMDGKIDQTDLDEIKELVLTNLPDTEPVASGNSLYIDPFYATAGLSDIDEKTFSVSMTNEVDIWGVQFDILLPEGMSLSTKDNNIIPNTDRLGSSSSDFNIETKSLEEGWTRVFVYPTAAERFITDFDGEILKAFYCTEDGMDVGDYPIQLRNVRLALQGLERDCPMFADAEVNVHEHVDVDGYCSICGELISYTRDITAGEYGTICLPKSAKITNVSGATLYTISGKRLFETDLLYSVVLEEVTELIAGKPYIFLADENANQLKVNYYGVITSEPSSENGLIGTFADADIDEGLYLVSGNRIVETDAESQINANCAYIDLTNVPVYTEPVPEQTKEILTESAVSVSKVNAERISPRMYNLSGVQLPKAGKGIFIFKNKKIFIR